MIIVHIGAIGVLQWILIDSLLSRYYQLCVIASELLYLGIIGEVIEPIIIDQWAISVWKHSTLRSDKARLYTSLMVRRV